MKTPLKLTWDLDVLYPNGSESVELEKFLQALEMDVKLFGEKAAELEQAPSNDLWYEMIEAMQNISARSRNASAFTSCLTAQNVKDQKAKLIQGRVSQLSAAYSSALTLIDKCLLEAPAGKWEALLSDERIAPVAFALEERRRRASDKLPSEQEALVGNLAVDGYHAWGSLYQTLIGRITIPVEKDGEEAHVSVGQAQNLMYGDPNPAVRASVFEKWEAAFANNAELFSNALNHLAGFRLQMYKARGWESVHREPLDNNRMSAETLNVMWEVINRNKDTFLQYLNRKAKLLGLEKLGWQDVQAPLGSATGKLSYDEGAAFIVEQFRKFSPKMADFAVEAFDGAWIEAEDRPGKRPGGFCTSFPLHQQSRIFMTYDGSMGGVSTLAHELGHAYHQSVMNDLPNLLQNYAMNVAETASTFAEMIVADAALQKAETEEERLAMLDTKIGNSVSFYMDIQARFIFETNFYEERRKGLVPVERLNELMVDAQKEAFCDALSSYHPHFWASKLHFYSTGAPFYNFPYTFGYLFSAGVYAQALKEGSSFQERYIDLLRDTGRMQVEDLARKHLGVDLKKPEFWQSAVDLTLADAREFLRLTEGK